MKVKAVILGCLICVVVLFVHEFTIAQPIAPAEVSRIGLVSVTRTLQSCKATATFGAKAKAESEQMDAAEKELEGKIADLTDAVRAFVPGTAEYWAQYKLLLAKQSELKAMQELHNAQQRLSQRQWAEKIYKEILRITKELAAAKSLDLVLERSEPVFPITSTDQLMMTLNTHKVLYDSGCVDITDEVIAELDKIESTLTK